eukprot:6601354-Pyramimonas_sp.AAC.1
MSKLRNAWTDQDLPARERLQQRGPQQHGRHFVGSSAPFQDVVEVIVDPEEVQDDEDVMALEERGSSQRRQQEARRIFNGVQMARRFFPVVGLAAPPPGGRGAAKGR